MKRHDKYFVYIIEDKNGTYYAGYTKNVEKRLELHARGKGAKYLRGKTPLKLVYLKEYQYFKSALNLERKIKSYTREQKEGIVKKFWLDNMERKMIEQYEAGYHHNPESIKEIKAIEKLSADAFAMNIEKRERKFKKALSKVNRRHKNTLKKLG